MSRPPAAAPPIASTIVGLELGPRRAEVDARWLMAYAAAAGAHRAPAFDTTTSAGPVAHPLFPVCYEWPLVLELRARAVGDAAAPFGVHASHRLALHRLPRAGDALSTVARIAAVTARRAGTLVMVRLVARDADGHLVSETDHGSLYRGVPLAGGSDAAGGARVPSAAPAPSAEAPGAPRWRDRVDVPYHLGHVYTECARIWNPIHTDVAVARAAGLPGPILHGTATLALAISRIVERDLDGDCAAVRGVEVRFAGMVPLSSIFTVQARARGAREIAFDAVDERGAHVLAEGVLRL